MDAIAHQQYIHRFEAVDFVPRKGFSCKPLDTKRVFDLYEVRCGLEMMSAKLATERASDDKIEALTLNPPWLPPIQPGQTTVCPYGLALWESGLGDSDLV